ncbi:hypothetical protein HanIR_Chr06g0274081 [Helianthus annuus]|nr:hypothetical protein HanIR_Chr06g0274081 [Helianthus annuus]
MTGCSFADDDGLSDDSSAMEVLVGLEFCLGSVSVQMKAGEEKPQDEVDQLKNE